MPYIKQPHNYKARITPYQQRLLLHGVDDGRVYLSRASNALLNAFTYGYDEEFSFSDTTSLVKFEYTSRDSCIIDGCLTSYTINGNILNVTIHPGTLVVDSTLLVFPEDTTVNLDLTNYNQTGIVVVSVQYKWLDTAYENAPRIVMRHVSQDRQIIQPDAWDADRDRLIITYLTYDKDTTNQVIESSIINCVPDPFQKLTREFVKIRQLRYELAPLSNIWTRLLKTVVNHFVRRVVKVISKPDWTLSPVFMPQLGGSREYYYCDVDVSPIFCRDIVVQCFVNDFKIEPAGTQLVDDNHIRIWMPDVFVTQENTPDLRIVAIG